MTFQTRNLSRDQAMATACAAAIVGGRPHVAYQLANGRWKWSRWNWTSEIVCASIAVEWQKFNALGQPGERFARHNGGRRNAQNQVT